jgi:IclR family pca regulon transcriptional regulator
MKRALAEAHDDVLRAGRDPYWIEGVARCLAVLAAFSPDKPELNLADISRQAGLTKASALRIGYTLTKLGYLSRNPRTRGYRLGAKVLSLGFATLCGMSVRDLARPYIEALAEETGQTVNLCTLDDTEVVVLDRIAKIQVVLINVNIGSRLPAYRTSMGRAILAFLPEACARDILARSDRQRVTAHTLTSIDEIMAELEQVRERGYAVNNEEVELGHRHAAAPIINIEGNPVGAINISVLAYGVSSAELEGQLVPAVIAACKQVSSLVGPGVDEVRVRPDAPTRNLLDLSS